jgi:hypothetical protein
VAPAWRYAFVGVVGRERKRDSMSDIDFEDSQRGMEIRPPHSPAMVGAVLTVVLGATLGVPSALWLLAMGMQWGWW